MNFKYIKNYITKDEIPFLIRPAQQSDATMIKNNINKVCAEEVFLNTNDFIKTTEWKQVLVKAVDNDSGYLLIVAEANGEVVGHLRIFPLWFGQKGRHVGEIGLLVIEPLRGLGIGTAMISYSLEWAKIADYKKMIASVFSSNIRALNLFFKFGFSVEGKRVNQLLINDKYFNEILLGYFLDEALSVDLLNRS